MAIIKPLQSITLKNDNGEDTTYVVASAPAVVETTEPASVASFTDGADGLPVISLIADINPVQTGSGDPSPTNIRLITGWTGMNVVRTGKNLCPTATITLGNGSPRTVDVYFAEPLPIGTYTFSASVTTNTTASANPGVQFITLNSNAGSAIAPIGTTGTLTKTITATEPIRRLYFYIGTTDYNNGKTIVFENIQVEVGSTATTYEPYNGTTYPISWADEAGTVYGGTLDVTTGLLTVTHELVKISDLSWLQHPTNTIVFYTTVSGKAVGSFNIMSDAFSVTTSSVASMTAGTMRGFTSNAVVYIAANSTDPTDFVNDYGTNQLLYELATPQTYQLTPQAVLTILGQNNIWADTGNVEVAYCADTELYINKVIAAL